MNILLISEGSKKALLETRRILDQFAERKGERTWQTAITQDGLTTLRKLLRRSARRNTAVACHWFKTSGQSELLWIVGNQRCFNEQGVVPTNSTSSDILKMQDENSWHTAEVMALLAGIAGLFHDLGKANWLFQGKLSGERAALSEPLRHEWITLRLFQAFVDGRDDREWIEALSTITPEAEPKVLACLGKIGERSSELVGCHNPFTDFSPLASVVGWLIVSHHRLPQFDGAEASVSSPSLEQLRLTSRRFDASWNSPQCRYPDWQARDWQQLWDFPYGTPFASHTWCAKASRLAQRALQCHSLWQTSDWLEDRFTSHLARLSLMLADHAYSAGPATEQWQDRDYRAYANTDRTTGARKQALDEHNIGVGHNAYLLAKSLPQLRRHLPAITRHKGFKQRSQNTDFRWQDSASC